MPKCDICHNNNAEVRISWPVTKGEQSHKTCDTCAQDVWNRMSRDFNGTDAFNGFSIEPLAD